MQDIAVSQLIPVLQTAIGPTILISGVGLLLLSMTNRLGRTIDRARILARELPSKSHNDRVNNSEQLRILWRRACLIRLSITLASTSALFAAILIIVLFITSLLQVRNAWLICALFIGCLACLIASLVVFIHDINLALAALKHELSGKDASSAKFPLSRFWFAAVSALKTFWFPVHAATLTCWQTRHLASDPTRQF
jgi:predicted MFS family arabinose efflux permease